MSRHIKNVPHKHIISMCFTLCISDR